MLKINCQREAVTLHSGQYSISWGVAEQSSLQWQIQPSFCCLWSQTFSAQWGWCSSEPRTGPRALQTVRWPEVGITSSAGCCSSRSLWAAAPRTSSAPSQLTAPRLSWRETAEEWRAHRCFESDRWKGESQWGKWRETLIWTKCQNLKEESGVVIVLGLCLLLHSFSFYHSSLTSQINFLNYKTFFLLTI